MKLLHGAVHRVPKDVYTRITMSAKTADLWNNLTTLGRNEFLCWIMSAKKPETRKRRITRTCEDLAKGKRRPCCWAGCTHRKK